MASSPSLNTTILFGLVTMGLSEVLRRQFVIAYGSEPHSNLLYVALVLCSFIAVHVAFGDAT